MIGKTIGKYRFVERLGRGGMGTVYKAVDETLDREVAVKVLNPELTDSEVMRRFRAEATTLARLNHPDIATIYEIFRSDSDLLMVMELVRGETLDQLATRCGLLPPERAAYLVAQVLNALEHAHRAGIVHRDLKPANVMVTDIGGVKIMDFGIARVSGQEHLTSDGHMMGTPAYMAPEQVVAKEVDARADLYAAGVVFYRLLTGNLPFQADTAIGMVQKQLSDQPTPAHMHRADLPDWCEGILTRALQKSPADRFQSAEEFRSELLSRIGSAATEHTGVFAAAHGATPLSMPVSGLSATPPRSTPTASGAFPAAGSGPAAQAAWPAATQKSNPKTEGATVVLQRSHFAVAGALLGVVAIGVAVLAFIALRRSTSSAEPAPAVQTAAAAPDSSAPAVAASPSTAAAVPEASAAAAPPTTAVPPTTSAPKALQPPPTPSQPPTTSAQPPATQDNKSAVALAANTPPASAAKPAEPTPTAHEAAAAAAAALPPFVFDAKAVVVESGKNREHDTKILLSEGKLTVTEKNDRVVTSLPFASVVGVSLSNSRQPMWNSPQGPAEMMKVEAGKLGFLKGGRNWLGLRTHDTSLVLRVDDEDLRRVIAALEARTGKKVERVIERKD